MTTSTFAAAYRSEIEKEIREIEISLGRGTAKSFDDYKQKTGRIDGHRTSLNKFSELIKKYIDESEIDD